MIKRIKNKIKIWLEKAGEKTKIDFLYWGKSGFWLNLRQVISSTSGLILSIAFANLIPKEVFGSYRYVISMAGILLIFSLSGANTAFLQAVSRGKEGDFKNIVKNRIKWSIFGSIISLFIAGYYYFFEINTTLSISFLGLSVILPFLDSFGVYSPLFLGRKNFKLLSLFNIFEILISFFALLLTAIFLKNAIALVFVFLLSHSIIKYLLYRKAIKKYPPNNEKSDGVLKFSKHLTAIQIINEIARQIGKILAFNFVGPIGLALYSFVVLPTENIKSLLGFITQSLFPKFAQQSFEKIKNNFFRKFIILLIPTIAIMTGYILLAPFIYKIFFPQYLEAIPLSIIYSISLLNIVPMIVRPAFQSHKKIRELYRLDIISSFIKITLSFIGAYFFGLIGLVVAHVLGRLIMSVISWIVFARTKIDA